MSQSFHKLEWDSDFLNFTVGKINGEIIHPPEGKDIEMLMKEKEAKRAYYSSPKQLPQTVQQSKELDYVLVDRKIVYSKPIHSELQIDPSILAIAKDTPDNKLSKLAIQSGEFSRFNKDERIEQRKFEELYELWMKHSLNKTIAKEVLAYHSGRYRHHRRRPFLSRAWYWKVFNAKRRKTLFQYGLHHHTSGYSSRQHTCLQAL